jgi:ATP-dependent Clp protease, protease subunit
MQQPAPGLAPQPEEAYISFSANILPNTTDALIAAVANLINRGVRRVHLLLSTPGGSVMHGITLHNVLRGFPIELTTHNVGNVDSIGSVVFLAGTRRYACPHSTFMFHGVSANLQAAPAPERFLIERLESVQADQRRIAAIVTANTRMDEATVESFFLQAATRTAEQAVQDGLIHEIRDVNVPPGVPILPLVFQS